MHLVLVLTVQLVLLLTQNVTSSNSISESPQINATTLKQATGTNKDAYFFDKLWIDLKRYGKKAEKKMKEWGKNIKQQTKTAKEYTIKKFQEMKDYLEKYSEKGKNVQICLKKHHNELEEVTRHVIEGFVVCLGSTVDSLTQIVRGKTDLILNGTAFVNKVENNLIKCIDNGVPKLECSRKVREKMLDDIEDLEQEILDDTIQKRNLMNDILESIAECSVKGLVNASSAITNTTIKIIHCVREMNETDVRALVCI